MNSLVKYFRDTAAELQQVHWPTQHQAMMYTVLVVVISIVVALFTGAFDHVFSLVIERVVNRF
ncbi:preprotein translocase subunit SecE [Candidatus Kaiserbacteria bacterium]|nr:preprotein translocase subunit SecE [Candidatus Kaiserbacteria bacterium]USN89060.1 MAG: preprotein translocase subunit SecE [Candidatus Nomurabacteria bacterium]